MILFHDPGFAAPIGEGHIMPIGKFQRVADAIRAAFPNVRIESPAPVTEADLLRVHTPEYVDAIRSGEPRALAESQKFPWTPELYESVRLTSGGVLAAAERALAVGTSGALASGFHHACADHGEGFCTFNGLVIAAEHLRASGRIRTAAVLDMDLHYGNGTASLAASRPWLRALSIYGNDYVANTPYRDVSVRHHEDGPNHLSVPLAPTGGPDLDRMIALMDQYLHWLVADGVPDLLLYQAGADPFYKDPYSPLQLDHADLRERDRRVFSFAKGQGIPVAWVLAGGYSKDIAEIVEVHVNTARAWLEVFG